MELEAKRKDDSSWHPCRVSLSSSGDSLIVNFGSQEMEDMVLKKEEVLMHIRFRSMPLQFDDCCHIEEGERVLANYNSKSKNLFLDAEVEKVERIRHSKRGCRCTFLIKWLDHDLKGQSVSVPSSSIMKLATKSISSHQVVHKLLKQEKVSCLSLTSPLSAILEGTDDEDLNKLLEKQIEKISKLADLPQKEFPEDILWRNRAENVTTGVANSSAESKTAVLSISRAKKSSANANLHSTAPIRLTRSAAQKGAIISNDGIQVEIRDDDMKRKIPGKKNRSSQPAVCQGNENLANAEENDLTHATDSDSSNGKIAAAESNVAIRLTRSAARKGAINPNDGIQVEIHDDDMKRRIPGKKNRSSQPAVCQGNENLGNEEENDLTHVTDSDSSNGKIAAAESKVATTKSTTSENTKAAFTPCNAEIHMLTEERNKSKETDSGRTNQGQKRKAVPPAKQDRRVSPRNFLPRTRSQHKAQTGKYMGIISS
ncbi:hypothetical protein CCACVL1_21252 [Corchorus capsularis]|uniref:SAWADEE domain-containing protein n=1 Tax=Corchorus capsularis TaxID=210143 RepID=A0A1R3H7D7_COCAP|nr:hypothetical protein CCACVL1_21252 [Corchorus capsularis]